MAAATVNNRYFSIFGDRRVVMADLNIANTNTFVTGLTRIESFSVASSTTTAAGATVSGGTMTFATGGSINNAKVIAVGF